MRKLRNISMLLVLFMLIMCDSCLAKNITVSFKNTDVYTAVAAIAKMSGENIVWSEGLLNSTPSLQKNTTVTSNGNNGYLPIGYGNAGVIPANINATTELKVNGSSRSAGKVTMNLKNVDVDTALNLILGVSDLTFVRNGGVIIVGREEKLRQRFGDLLDTKIITLKYIGAREAKEVLVNIGVLESSSVQATDCLFKNREDKDKQLTAYYYNNNQREAEEDEQFSPYPRNMLIISAPKQKINRAVNIINEIDVPAKQITMEVKVIEVSEQGAKDLGIQWELPSFGFQETGDGVFQGGGMNVSIGNFSSQLKALVVSGKAKILSSPKIMALDGQKASVFVGDRVPYDSYMGDLKTVDIGIKLVAIPRVLENDEISIKLKPKVSTVSEWKTINGRIFPIEQARELDTLVRAKNGEEIILGGLINEIERKTTTKIPVLGNIPLVGSLFKWDSSNKSKTEIIFMLTPLVSQQNN